VEDRETAASEPHFVQMVRAKFGVALQRSDDPRAVIAAEMRDHIPKETWDDVLRHGR